MSLSPVAFVAATWKAYWVFVDRGDIVQFTALAAVVFWRVVGAAAPGSDQTLKPVSSEALSVQVQRMAEVVMESAPGFVGAVGGKPNAA